ncbi:MAG: hypothetical protein JKY56_17245 [Kofleriaceae bacterium]|nr:hypothetical protein [Kofleriaceae bacterium]
MKQSTIPMTLILASALIAPLMGCVDAADSIVILNNQVPEAGCILKAGTNEPFFSRGQIDVVDLSQTNGYLFTPVILNRAVGNDSSDSLFFAEGANVDLEFIPDFFSEDELAQLKADGNSRFLQEFSGSVAAEGTGTFDFEIIPRTMLSAIAAKLQPGDSTRVLAKVEIVGKIGGGGVSSQLFSYPVDVCNGCLANNLGTCDQVPLDLEIRAGGSCQPLQDGVADCCTRTDGVLICPAISTALPPEL